MSLIVRVLRSSILRNNTSNNLSWGFSVSRSAANAPAPADSVKHVDPDMPIDGMKNPYEKERRQCILCKYEVEVDYKNPRLLSQFVSPFTGKVYDRNITGLCKKQQARVEEEIERSRFAGFMPFMIKKVEYTKDPKLFDPLKPLRPHPY